MCTRTEDRVEAVLACAEAGVRAVYAEKPLAQSLAEADRLVAECEARGIVLAVGCTRRWDAWHRATRELVASGRLGTPRQVTGMLHCGLSHNGSHLIDIVRFHAGDAPVEWVFGEMESDEAAAGEADLAGNGYLRFANGVTGFVRALPCGPVGVEVDVLCDDGRVRGLGNGIEWELWRAGGSYRGLSREPFPRPQRIRSPNLAAAHDVVACLAHGGTPACSGRDGLAALEIAIALRQSHRERARIALPLADRGLRIVPHA